MTKILKPFYIETRQQALCADALSALNVPLSVLRNHKKDFMLIMNKDDPNYKYTIITFHLGGGWVIKFSDAVIQHNITKVTDYTSLVSVLPPTAEKVSDTEDLLANTRIDAKLMLNAPCSKPIIVCAPTTTPGIPYLGNRKPGTTDKSGDLVKIPNGNIYMCTDDKCTLTLFAANSKEQQTKKGIKPRGRDRLVFTYTNGATYTVRGLVSAEFDKSSMAIKYRTRKTDLEGHVHEEAVTRYVTNELSTAVLEHASGWNKVLLDLRTNSEKVKVVGQPTRNKQSRAEWEALEAQKAKDTAKQARIAELQKELASLSK